MNTYFFEMTDTFGGELNYCWVRRFEISAKSLHGALMKLSRETGFNFRSDGNLYRAKRAHIAAFEVEFPHESVTWKKI